MTRHVSQSHRSFKAGMALCVLMAAAALIAPAPAAPPPTEPSTSPAAENAAMDVIVLEVKGTVQASVDDGKTWTPAKAGMKLPQGASFRTGFRSSVTCGIPPDQGFTLESLGTVRVDEAIKKGKHFKTDLVMKYGATNYSIETGGAEHETTIRTPGSTLSIRGTVVRVTDRPGFAPTAESFTGRATFKTARGTATVGKKGGSYARVSSDQADAALTALSQTVVDPAAVLARTATDAQLIAQQTSLGAVSFFDYRTNITVVRDSAPLSDAALASSLPGPLDFVLRWTGNAALNLQVFDEALSARNEEEGQIILPYLKPAPTQSLTPVALGQIALIDSIDTMGFKYIAPDFQPQETLYPGYGLNVSHSGGVIPYANQGGPKGGMEICYWPASPPQGIYGVQVDFISGAPATFQLNAYQNGVPLTQFFPANGTLVRGTNLVGTLSRSNNVYYGNPVFSPANPYYDTVSTVATDNVPSLFAGTAASPAAAVRPAEPARTRALTPNASNNTKPPSVPGPVSSSTPTAAVRVR